MMTKEQEIFEKVNRIRIDFFDSKYKDVHTDDELAEKYEALGDVLNMLKEKDKEIEKLQEENETTWKLIENMSKRHFNDVCKIKNNEKQIDLMAEKIFQEGIVWDDKEEVKQYFKSKVEKE